MRQTKRAKKVASIVRMLKYNPLAKAKDVALRYNCSINYAYSLVAQLRNKLRMRICLSLSHELRCLTWCSKIATHPHVRK